MVKKKKNPPANAGDVSLIPGSYRSPGGGTGNPLQYFRLGIPVDREAWQAAVCGVSKESDTTEPLIYTHIFYIYIDRYRYVQLLHREWCLFPVIKGH